MTITSYQVDSVLNAYTRQNKVKISNNVAQSDAVEGKYKDVVSLSGKEDTRVDEFEKISYSLRDVILKSNQE
jgi:hypothetical protein